LISPRLFGIVSRTNQPDIFKRLPADPAGIRSFPLSPRPSGLKVDTVIGIGRKRDIQAFKVAIFVIKVYY